MPRIFLCLFVALAVAQPAAAEKMQALIMDGQNNHSAWPKTTFMMKQYLEETGLFEVDIVRSAYTWKGDDLLKEFPLEGQTYEPKPKPQADPNFSPDFSKYDVIVNNFGFNASPLPQKTKTAFDEFVKNGGGLVVVHAADNSWGDWPSYNLMIGLGGWGGRNESSGPYVYLDDNGKVVRDTSKGRGGHHGPQREYAIRVRNTDHPITKGMPAEWMHGKDELYDQLRGPGKNMEILATAYADKSKGGSGRHEPMLMTITYGKGRVFHTPMGHADYSMECVGFITTLKRGTEWAATGKVTQTEIPKDFPAAEQTSAREFRLLSAAK